MTRFFDGYATDRMEELGERKLKGGPLVKTSLLEVLSGEEALTDERLLAIFGRRKVRLEPLDDTLFLVTDDDRGSIGFLERVCPRIVALYSVLFADDFGPWSRRIVMRTPELDHVWLSGLTFRVLWKLVARSSHSHRFTQLVFTHNSIFDIDGTTSESEEDDEEVSDACRDEDPTDVVDRRATSFTLVDRVGVIQEKLSSFQELYSPLYAISRLRFPSSVGRGGHDFYDNGRVTNRSGSFRDHRSHVLFVVRIYEELLKSTEQRAWYSVGKHPGVGEQLCNIVGAPVVIRFEKPLENKVFDRWVSTTFERKRNRFRLWGHPIRLGPTKVHVYGVDRHLWQPLFLELTAKGCTAIIPKGTCGNTVHRLVTNIQRYLSPGAEVFIGDKPYIEIVEEAARKIGYNVPSE